MNAYVASLCILYKIHNVDKFVMYKFFMQIKEMSNEMHFCFTTHCYG